MDDTGAAAKFPSQTFKVTRYCLRRKVDAKDVGVVDGNPASESLDALDGMQPMALIRAPGDGRLFLVRG